MTQPDINSIGAWFDRRGPNDDVVISSRVRLSRNLAGFCFPGVLSYNEEEKVKDLIINAVLHLEDKKDFQVCYLDSLKPLVRKLLLEKNLITQEFSIANNKVVIFKKPDTTCGMINETDHLKLASFACGLSLKDAYKSVDSIDVGLEANLNYAVSLEWGYLSSSLTNIGTGMRASLMLHLPALVSTSLISKAIKTIVQLGVSIKGFFSDGQDSLGDIYQISNQVSVGVSEKEILENLEEIALQIVNYERKAREEMLTKERVTVLDKIFRALGILLYCRSISAKEAIGLLSTVRMGLALDLLKGIELHVITGLIFTIQKYHIINMLGDDEEVDNMLVDYSRAKRIRETLSTLEISGGE
jgi:protein arginine kinase